MLPREIYVRFQAKRLSTVRTGVPGESVSCRIANETHKPSQKKAAHPCHLVRPYLQKSGEGERVEEFRNMMVSIIREKQADLTQTTSCHRRTSVRQSEGSARDSASDSRTAPRRERRSTYLVSRLVTCRSSARCRRDERYGGTSPIHGPASINPRVPIAVTLMIR
jgi:hypothetical protein